jgi:6-phosphofructokinase 1
VLATRFGLAAAELVLNGQFGRMVAWKGMSIIDAPLSEGVANPKNLDLSFYQEASAFFQ